MGINKGATGMINLVRSTYKGIALFPNFFFEDTDQVHLLSGAEKQKH